ncbi:hypothetical protein VNI00_014120 [Paramarasmius palmivorus]|uniref:Uncharacterized protein n=1 Tax=Paramarasmius palmivorus TaxID=297713 RepID=A0AAW0BUB5_9AGAR
MNPGGPGHPGTYLAMQKGDEMAQIIGEDWDLVGFDPRGVGKTIPSTRCFSDIQSYRDMFANTVVERGITVPSIKDLSSPDLREALLLQYEELLSLKRAQGGICRDSMGDELAYMGSATVARDVEFMSRVLDGKDTPINYWGESYGTVIGSFLVNLFPERIGRVVIDGVVNPVLLTTEPTHKWPANWLLDAEKTYGIFLEDCSEAGPERCPLALSQGELPEAIERRLEFFFDETARRPIPVPDGHRPGVLTSGTARALLLISLQNPKHWVATAQNFAEAMKGNATALYNIHIPPPLSPNTSFTDILPPFTPDLQRQAITCLDSPPPYPPDEAYPSAEDYTEQGLFTLNTVSRHFGASTGVGEPDGGCEWWPVKRREEDNVNFGNANGKLKDDGKILVISNTADPITPLSSGVLVNSLLPDSSVLAIQDGPGHCSTSFPSECIRQIQRDYFAGRLPKNGTVCKVEKGAFAV